VTRDARFSGFFAFESGLSVSERGRRCLVRRNADHIVVHAWWVLVWRKSVKYNQLKHAADRVASFSREEVLWSLFVILDTVERGPRAREEFVSKV